MQFLLTAEEWDKIRQERAANHRMPSKEVLQKFCTHVADTLMVTDGWAAGRTWGCILTASKNMGYCDQCPARDVCPYENKSWSK